MPVSSFCFLRKKALKSTCNTQLIIEPHLIAKGKENYYPVAGLCLKHKCIQPETLLFFSY